MRYQIRHEKLESFGHAPAFLFNALRQFPKKMWLFEPAPDRWSIHSVWLVICILIPTSLCAQTSGRQVPPGLVAAGREINRQSQSVEPPMEVRSHQLNVEQV